MALVYDAPEDGNLSQEKLVENWNKPPEENSLIITNDYISKSIDISNLFENDKGLDTRITTIEAEIDGIKIRLDAVEILAASNELRLDALEPRVDQNETDIANNAAQIATNITNIAQNTSDIADINDGRYSPQDGTGSPEAVVTANNSKLYIDTAANQTYYNPVIGANTGWILT